MNNLKPPPSMEESLRETIREMVNNGISRPSIVKQLNEAEPSLNLTYAQVYHVTRDLGGLKVDITKSRVMIGDRPRREVIMELYDKGIKPKQISIDLVVDHKTVLQTIYEERQKRAAKQQFERLPESPALRKQGPEY